MCAVIKQGILGGFSGSLGSVTGSSWKGIAVMKAKPLSVANPQTAAQTAQRLKMTTLVAIFKMVLSTVIKPLNDRFAIQMSGFNACVSASMPAFDVAGDIDDYTKVKVCTSSKGEQNIASAGAHSSTGLISITWVSTAGIGTQLATDRAYLVAINQTNNKAIASSGLVARSALALTLAFDSTFAEDDDILSLYLVFLKADGTVAYKQAYATCNVEP